MLGQPIVELELEVGVGLSVAIIAFKNKINLLLINILTLSDMTSEILPNHGGP